MGLAAGTRLGPYEIAAPLGAGGMGEVYRARDTRLGRWVAIKTLSSEFAHDSRFRARFDREAKAISALSHPHICALYDIGPDFLVMELCDGKTLANRIASGPLPVEQAINYAIQIADALDQAHRAGIIHRDLKPSNIMITKSGVKLLDFGLAKQQVCPPSEVRQETDEQEVLGTVQYMAPELFQGKDADARTDVFALGLVLYEMVTGKPAFSGRNKAIVVAAMLEDDPAHVEGQAALDRLIRACLEKDPNERIQTAHDVLLELRWMADGFRTTPIRPKSKARSRPALFITAAGLAVSGLISWHLWQDHGTVVRAARFQLQPPPGVTVVEAGGLGVRGGLAVSPDGEQVAFCARKNDNGPVELYLRSTRELEARLVAGSARATDPFFSPDSRWLGFVADGFLQKVAVDGGQPTRICPATMVRGVSWGGDGTILFSAGRELLRVSAAGGVPRLVTNPQLPQRHIWPHFLPDGHYALITIMNGMADRWRTIGVLSLADGRIEKLVPGTYPRYASGRIIYAYAGTLFSLGFDAGKLKTIGEPTPVLDDVYFYSGSGRTSFDLSRSGSLVYIPGARRARDSEIVWIDRHGDVTPATDHRRPYIYAILSPDGKRIAVTTWESIEDRDLWVLDLERGITERLTVGMQVVGPVSWFPDGRSIVASSMASGYQKLVRIPAEGGGATQPLTFGIANNDAVPAVAPDGSAVVFRRYVGGDAAHLMRLSLIADQPPRPFIGSASFEDWPAFSPDGRWLAYESAETGASEVHVRPFPAGAPKITVSSGGGERPIWSRDGRELFYRKGKDIWSVPISLIGGFHAGTPKRLFSIEWLPPNSDGFQLQPSPDGKRFLAVRLPPEEHPDRRIVYAPNWLAEARQKN